MDKKMILRHNMKNGNPISCLNILSRQKPGGEDIVYPFLTCDHRLQWLKGKMSGFKL